MMARIWPDWPAATASGLMMAKGRSILEGVLYFLAGVGGGGADDNTSGGHGGDFIFGFAAASGDDRAGVAHAAAGGRGLSGNEADHGLLHVFLDKGRGLLLGLSAH